MPALIRLLAEKTPDLQQSTGLTKNIVITKEEQINQL